MGSPYLTLSCLIRTSMSEGVRLQGFGGLQFFCSLPLCLLGSSQGYKAEDDHRAIVLYSYTWKSALSIAVPVTLSHTRPSIAHELAPSSRHSGLRNYSPQ